MYAKIQDSIIIHQKQMIEKYIVVTGVQSQKEEDLESMYNLKKQVEMDESNKKFDDEVVRKKRWRKRTFVVSAIAIIEGAIIYLIISM
jgi:glutaredoxin-related protein